MKLLSEWIINHRSTDHRIELLSGDLARIPPDHDVDFLVVSAFPDDYTPTPTSLIGALDRAGVSVRELARDKEVDLRPQYSCWCSKRVGNPHNFGRLLCIESGWRGTPPEIVDDLFRALAPFLLTDHSGASIATPLIGSGDQGWPATDMLRLILETTVIWIEKGLPLGCLKIVVKDDNRADGLREVFDSLRTAASDQLLPNEGESSGAHKHWDYDVFLSYSHYDSDVADWFVSSLSDWHPGVRIFRDIHELHGGAFWVSKIAAAIDGSRRVVPLYTQKYWQSRICTMEFNAALSRHLAGTDDVLFPIFVEDAAIPNFYLQIQFSDCRAKDQVKISEACRALAHQLRR